MKKVFIYISLLLILPFIHPQGDNRIIVKQYKADLRNVFSHFVGMLSSANVTHLQSEVNGRIEKLYKKEGSFVRGGDPIVSLEKEHLLAELKKINTLLKEALYHYKTTYTLFQKGYVAKPAYLSARSKLYTLHASAKKIREEIENKVIVAPFDGYIDKITVKKGDYLSVRGNNQNIGTFFSSDFIATVSAPESFLDKIADIKEVRVKIRNIEAPGKISFVSRVLNPKSRTFNIEISLPELIEFTLGESVDVKVTLEQKMLQKIPSSALVVDDTGQLGVKVIEESGLIRFKAVSIVDIEDGQSIVSGLPDIINLITHGTLYARIQ